MSRFSAHATAIVDERARIGDGAEIGPYCTIGPNVALGRGVALVSHVVVTGRTTIGEGTRVFPFASLGSQPQDLKFKGEETTLQIGAHCTIREGVTMNPGTVGDYAILGGGAGVHQFVRIGHHAFVGGLAGVENDVIPYGMALGNRAGLAGLNIVGMKRLGFSRETIQSLRHAYRLLFSNEGTLVERIADVESDDIAKDLYVREILDFIKAASDRSLCVPRSG